MYADPTASTGPDFATGVEPLSIPDGGMLLGHALGEPVLLVKWLAAIEFVQDFADVGGGQGGHNEDHELCDHRMPI